LGGRAAARRWGCRWAVGAHPSRTPLLSALLVAGDAFCRAKAVDAFGVAAGVAVLWLLAGLVLGLFFRKVTERCCNRRASSMPCCAFLCEEAFLFLTNLRCNTEREASENQTKERGLKEYTKIK
jgi:hypothetical protein